MTVKQCAEEFGISQSLVRELLKQGLLRGQKSAQGWTVDSASMTILGETLATLREHASPRDDIELPADCWDWLHEVDLPKAPAADVWTPGRWSPPPPLSTPASQWLVAPTPPRIEASVEEEVPPTIEIAAPKFTRAKRKKAPQPKPALADGPPCPTCQNLTFVRIMDADIGGWHNYCEHCGEWVLEFQAGESPAHDTDPSYTVHAVDVELESRLST